MSLGRRNFMGMGSLALCAAALKAGTVHPAAGDAWKGWSPGRFQVHFIYTGVGESMFLIFPDGSTALLDAGDHAAVMRGKYALPVLPSPYKMAGEWVQRYVLRVNPNGPNVDYMLVSHLHADHTGTPSWQSNSPLMVKSNAYFRSGLGIVAEEIRFGKMIDRGCPDYNDPIPHWPDLNRIGEHLASLRSYLEARDGMKFEKYRLGATDQIVPVRGSAEGFSCRVFAVNGRAAAENGDVTDFYTYLKARGAKKLNENGMSAGLLFKYGKFSFLTAGDFSDGRPVADGSGKKSIEEEIAPMLPRVNVAKLNHHGHNSMPAALVKALAARVWIACVWDQKHLTPDTYSRLIDRSLYPGERMVFPGCVPNDIAALSEADRADIPAAAYSGAHIVLDVKPGGDAYTISALTAADESMRVVAAFDFAS